MDNPFQIKPTRMNFQGDKELAASHAGDAKRMLFQLKNIQKTNNSTQELTKRYEDGTVINVHSKVKGMDVVNIFSIRGGYKEEEKIEYREETFFAPVIMAYKLYDRTFTLLGGYVAEKFKGRRNEYVEVNKKKLIEYSHKDVKLEELEISGQYAGVNNSQAFVERMEYEVISETPSVEDPRHIFTYGSVHQYTYYLDLPDKEPILLSQLVIDSSSIDNYIINRSFVTEVLIGSDSMVPCYAITEDKKSGDKKYIYIERRTNYNNGTIYSVYSSWHFEILESRTYPQVNQVITIKTDSKEFVLYDYEYNLDLVRESNEVAVYDALAYIYEFNGEYIYSYAYNLTQRFDLDNPIRKIVYGYIYKDKNYQITFDAYTDWYDREDDTWGPYYHKFEKAIFKDADGKETEIEFPDDMKGLCSSVHYLSENANEMSLYRFGKYIVTTRFPN